MKKILFPLILLLPVLSSCEEEIGELTENEAPRLVINAIACSGLDEDQCVIMSKTGKNQSDVVYNPEVNIYVNGEGPLDTHISGSDNCKFFSAKDIKPGDVVSIKASHDGLHASAETVVPEPIIITGIDTMTVMAKRYWYSSLSNLSPHTRYLVHLRLPDGVKKNETRYFRVSIYKDTYTWSAASERDGEIEYIRYSPFGDHGSFSYSQDPALSENENNFMQSSDSDIEIDWLEGEVNEYHVFRSAYFKDGEYTLRLDLQAFPEYEQYGWYQNVKIRIYSISQIEYNYLQALPSLESYEPGVITDGEPIMPSNVNGGAGIFCVESCTTAEFFEDHRKYELIDGKYVPIQR